MNRPLSPALAALRAQKVEHRAYWVAKMIWGKGERAVVEAMAMRDDVARVYANPKVRFAEPRLAAGLRSPDAIEWNITKVKADQAWGLGHRGSGGGGIGVGGRGTRARTRATTGPPRHSKASPGAGAGRRPTTTTTGTTPS